MIKSAEAIEKSAVAKFVVLDKTGTITKGSPEVTDIVTNNDVNSYTTKLSAIMMGCSETTFYVLTVYFGAVGIRKYRYAIFTGLFADFIGIVMSIAVARYFFA